MMMNVLFLFCITIFFCEIIKFLNKNIKKNRAKNSNSDFYSFIIYIQLFLIRISLGGDRKGNCTILLSMGLWIHLKLVILARN